MLGKVLLARSFAVGSGRGRGRGRGHVVERRELGGSEFGYSCCSLRDDEIDLGSKAESCDDDTYGWNRRPSLHPHP